MIKQILLVKKAQKGDHESFITLVQGYEEVLYKMGLRLLENEEDVADVLQETILMAFQKISKLKNPRYFNTWICKILINNCQKMLKSRRFYIDLEDITVNNSTDETHHLYFEDMLVHLDERYSIPLTLHYYYGFSIKEISQLLNEPVGTIKSRLSRGRQKLKEQEGGHYIYE